MKKIILTAIILLAINGSYAQNTWTKKADFGGGLRNSAVAFSIDGKGYIGTGDDQNNSPTSDFWEYNPGTNVWTQKANFGGGARESAAGFSLNGKGYIGTGTGGNFKKDFWEFNPGSNTWVPRADFGGTARSDATGFSIGNKGYIGTGYGENASFCNDFWEYNPVADTWALKADFGGGPRSRATGFSIGDKGYIGTGGDESGNYYTDLWQYDPGANTWSMKAAFGGFPRVLAIGFSLNNKGYIGTGYGNSTSGYNDFWEYDPDNNTWTQKADFSGTGRWGAAGFSIGDKGYIGAGAIQTSDGNYEFYSDFREFTGGNNEISTNAVLVSSVCAGSNITVSFSLTGTSNDGNTYTAQLSNAAGSFASPVNIGSLSSVDPGNISADIPPNTPVGNGYRIRVISDKPDVTGTDNGTNITIVAIPTASISYPGSPYPATGSAIVTQTGPAGGTYTSTSGLVIDVNTGTINLGASTPGTYTVTYHISGPCLNITTTDVTIGASQTSISYPGSPYCATGTATVTRTGQGGGTYSSTSGLVINSNTGAINLATSKPGTYKITYKFHIGNKNNTTTAHITIKASPKAALSAGTISCYGDLTTLKVNAGGTGSLKYKLSTNTNFQSANTFTVGAHTYTVTVQDAGGCTITTNPITITQPPVISITLDAGTISCYGGTTTLMITASGGKPGYTYSLNGCAFQSSNKFVTSVKTCVVTVKDSKGCTAVKSININQPSQLKVSLSGKTNTCYNSNTGSLIVNGSGGTLPYSYKINTANSYQSKGTFNNLAKGTYSVTVKDKNGCTATIAGISINTGNCNNNLSISANKTPITGINEETPVNATVYPNPSVADFTLKINGNINELVEVRVIDMYGRPVYKTKGTANQSYRFGQHFAAGMYLVEISQGRNVKILKIIKGN